MEAQVKEYLSKITGTELYDSLDEAGQDKIIFTAMEVLKDNYRAVKINPRVVSLQVLYMLEGESEDFTKLGRHGVKSATVKGVSIALEDYKGISPEVINILGVPVKAGVGRLI